MSGNGERDHAPQRVGRYRYFFGDEHWDWSVDVQAMHGYQPGTVSPATDVVLGHVHRDDVGAVLGVLHRLRTDDASFNIRYRIMNVHNDIREVMMIGEALRGAAGDVVGAQGFYIDVTPDDRARDVAITEAVSEIADNRAVIEQVKGILQLVYGIDANVAFAVLKWRSQETNIKLRVLAERIMVDIAAIAGGESLPARTVFDDILLTAHERVASDQA